jgi:hypothetical protein
MIKMKRLIRSLVIASGGLFIAATASNAASISFTPTGTQLDTDEILDIEASPGQVINFSIDVNTFFIETAFDLPNREVEINFTILLDSKELQFLKFPENSGIFPTIFVPQNTLGRIIVSTRVLDGLTNDGSSDFAILFRSAYIGGHGFAGENVSRSFGGVGDNQRVEVQPVPEPATIFGSALALSVGGWLKRKKSSQQNKTTPH